MMRIRRIPVVVRDLQVRESTVCLSVKVSTFRDVGVFAQVADIMTGAQAALADSSGAELSRGVVVLTEPDLVATFTGDVRHDRVRELKSGALLDLLVITKPTTITVTEAERLQLVETVLADRLRASRRGSWFVIPKIRWDAREWRDLQSRAGSLSMKQQQEIGLRKERALALGQIDKNGNPRPSVVAPELVKRDSFVDACSVICMHCLREFDFMQVDTRWSKYLRPCCPYPSCGKPLWPSDGWLEANIARRLTGDFKAFNTMLMYPPLADD